jgi:tetratricopeptide (TPR) repeat protein
LATEKRNVVRRQAGNAAGVTLALEFPDETLGIDDQIAAKARDLIALADRLMFPDDWRMALDIARQALAIFKILTTRNPDKVEWRYGLSVSHDKVGEKLDFLGLSARYGSDVDPESSLGEYRAALEINKELVAGDPGNTEWWRNLSVSHERVGERLADVGNPQGALGEYRTALDIREKLAETNPGKDIVKRDDMEAVRNIRSAMGKIPLEDTERNESLESNITRYNVLEFTKTNELQPASAEKDFKSMPSDFGPTKQEILQLTTDQLVQGLAQDTRTSTEDAKTIIFAVRVNAAAMIEASQKLLKPKAKVPTAEPVEKSSRRKQRHVFTEEELHDPKAIDRARDTLADIESARHAGSPVPSELREAGRRASALLRRVRQFNAA